MHYPALSLATYLLTCLSLGLLAERLDVAYSDRKSLVRTSLKNNVVTCSIKKYTAATHDEKLSAIITQTKDIKFLLSRCNLSLPIIPDRHKRWIYYYGTNWCGPGNRAANDEDFGYNKHTDVCCREHDKCQPKITPWTSKYGIINFSIFTWSHCDCDHAFFNCLKRINNHAANTVGNIFFNIGNFFVKCIREINKYKCVKRSDGWWWTKGACQRRDFVKVMTHVDTPTY